MVLYSSAVKSSLFAFCIFVLNFLSTYSNAFLMTLLYSGEFRISLFFEYTVTIYCFISVLFTKFSKTFFDCSLISSSSFCFNKCVSTTSSFASSAVLIPISLNPLEYPFATIAHRKCRSRKLCLPTVGFNDFRFLCFTVSIIFLRIVLSFPEFSSIFNIPFTAYVRKINKCI